MANKDLNRIKVVLAERKCTAKWLATQMHKDSATVSKWCTNQAQPSCRSLPFSWGGCERIVSVYEGRIEVVRMD